MTAAYILLAVIIFAIFKIASAFEGELKKLGERIEDMESVLAETKQDLEELLDKIN